MKPLCRKQTRICYDGPMKTVKRIKTHSLPVRRGFLDKRICLKEAEQILHNRYILHMTRKQLAAEIYFHALVYHWCGILEKLHLPVHTIKRHANPIDLSDHGDTPFRQFCYNVIWLLPGRHIRDDQEN